MIKDKLYKVVFAIVFLFCGVFVQAKGGRFGYYDYFRMLESKNIRISTSLSSTALLGKASNVVPHWGGIDVAYTQWKSRHWGFSVGLKYGQLSSMFKSDADQSFPLIDQQGQSYELLVETKTKEELTLNYIAIPFSGCYRHAISRLMDFEVGVGVTLGYLNRANYSMVSGYFSRKAWYDDLNILIEDLPQKQLGRYDSFAPTTSLDKGSFYTAAHLNLSLRYDLSKLKCKPLNRFFIVAGVSSEFTLQRIAISTPQSLNSLTTPYQGELINSDSPSFRTLSCGVFLGISYSLDDRVRGSSWDRVSVKKTPFWKKERKNRNN